MKKIIILFILLFSLSNIAVSAQLWNRGAKTI